MMASKVVEDLLPHFWICLHAHEARAEAIDIEAGELAIPFTSGILVGIGETEEEQHGT